MNTEISALLQRFENVLGGDPWYGHSVYNLLDELDVHKTSISLPGTTQTLTALLWHMNH